MAKTMLNQTTSRPILYTYAQEQIAKTPSKWSEPKQKAIQEVKDIIPEIKKIVTKSMTLLLLRHTLIVHLNLIEV